MRVLEINVNSPELALIDNYQQEMHKIAPNKDIILSVVGLYESTSCVGKNIGLEYYKTDKKVDIDKILTCLGDVFLYACAVATNCNWKASDVLKVSYNKLLLQKISSGCTDGADNNDCYKHQQI